MELIGVVAPGGAREARTLPALSFRFVVDARGRILQVDSDPALRELGWDEALVGRSCMTAVACRDLSGAALCDTCTAAREQRTSGPSWRRPVARMRATAGDVIARSSEVRRLLRRRLRIEVTV